MLSYKANIEKINKQKRNCLYLASYYGHYSCVHYIKKHTSLRFKETQLEFPESIVFQDDSDDEIFPIVTAGSMDGLIRHLVYDQYSG